MTLFECEIDQEVKVISVEGIRKIRKRLIDMGITTNTKLKIIRKAPLGDPIEIKLRGYSLSLRMDDAKKIKVEKV
ncbi:MAG: ferrous iron transport protein A [Erysipelotrichaceae bacterium]|jgi:Fe2+ transport system protein FeoA|nr:ferrous iron transport protein A [Bacillota bacterium]NLP21654.1 ferrous iron transport protein A [Erysipelotrichaceae bacterium]HCY06877.1 ferrous iron transport protein A [Erysipelotrichaceae bacterium]